MSIWFRTPWPLRMVASFTAWFVYGATVSNLLTPQDNARVAPIVWGVCLAGAAGMITVDAGVHRRFGSLEDLRGYTGALRSGELPHGAEVDVWQHRIAQSRLSCALAMTIVAPLLAVGWMSAAYSEVSYHALAQYLFAVAVFVTFGAAWRRSARVSVLASAVKPPNKVATPSVKVLFQAENMWRSNAESSMAGRLVMSVTTSTVLAFVPLILADLDAVVYDDNRLTHLTWLALCAAVMGAAVTATAHFDPRARATVRTIDALMEYHNAFRTGELPQEFDVDQWRSWLRDHRMSDVVTLIWACFYVTVGSCALITNPSGYHWILASVLAVLAFWLFRRWRLLCRLTARLHMLIERHTIRQLFG
jgi:hypothetical protein